MNVTQFLTHNTLNYPRRPAIGFKKEDQWKQLNWQEFSRVVYKTANALKDFGIKSGDKVGIYSDNSAEWIVFDLAAMALGAITVPLYATANASQVSYILGEAQVRVLLVGNQEQYDLAYELMEGGLEIEQFILAKKKIWSKKNKSVYLDDFIKDAGETFEIEPKTSDDVATLIYTSGTTGEPKGVMLTHGNFTSCIEAHFEFFKFKAFENEHSLAFLPLTHVFERSWTLLCFTGGAKVSFLENTKLIASALVEVKPTLMCAVPRFYQKIYAGVQGLVEKGSPTKKKIFNWALTVGSERAEAIRKGSSPSFSLQFKYAVANGLVFQKIKNKLGGALWFMPCGGASVSPEVTRFFDAIGLHMTVGYGLTETTATLTAFPFVGYEHGACGKPLKGTEIKIGPEDEILVKGPGIMKGYYKKSQQTASVFTQDGWFKTGDAGRLDSEGQLYITDRIKDLMKTSNGKYIAPQPIENTLSNDEFISQAMLIAEGRPYASAIIVPNFEALEPKLASLNLTPGNWQELTQSETLIAFYTEKLVHLQKDLQGHEKIKKFILLPKEFEIESGEITPTLKVKRNVVLEKYHQAIETMYQA